MVYQVIQQTRFFVVSDEMFFDATKLFCLNERGSRGEPARGFTVGVTDNVCASSAQRRAASRIQYYNARGSSAGQLGTRGRGQRAT